MKVLFPYSLLRFCLVGVLSLALIFAPFPSSSRNQALAFEPLSTTLVVGGITLTVAQFMLISSVVATTAALICQGVSKDEAIARGMEALARENQALLDAAQVEFRKLFSLDEHRLSFQETCNAITDLRFQSASLGFAHEGLTPLAPSPEISAALEFQYSNANSVLQERIFDAFAMEGLNLRNISIHDEVSFQNAFYEMEYLMENEIFVAKLQKIFEETEALWLSEASVSTRAFLMSKEGSEIASATSQKMENLMRCLRIPEFWKWFTSVSGMLSTLALAVILFMDSQSSKPVWTRDDFTKLFFGVLAPSLFFSSFAAVDGYTNLMACLKNGITSKPDPDYRGLGYMTLGLSGLYILPYAFRRWQGYSHLSDD